MTTPTNLDTLPVIVMEKILEKCNFLGILSLRKTCRSIRSSVILIKPKFHIRDLKIKQISSESIRLTIRITDHKDIQVAYKKHENGCQVTSKSREKVLGNQDSLQIFFHDLAIIFESQHSGLPFLQVGFHKEDVRFYENLEKYLKTVGRSLKIKNLDLGVYDQYQILAILPYVAEDSIGKIWILDPEQREFPLNLEEVVKLEQWKKAKEMEILWVTVVPEVKDFVHFEICNVTNFEILKPEDVVMVKEAFFTSNTPKYFRLGYNNFVDSQNLLEFKFGEPHVYPDDIGFEEKAWWLNILDQEHVLHVEITNAYVEFTRTEMQDVPEHIRENL